MKEGRGRCGRVRGEGQTGEGEGGGGGGGGFKLDDRIAAWVSEGKVVNEELWGEKDR